MTLQHFFFGGTHTIGTANCYAFLDAPKQAIDDIASRHPQYTGISSTIQGGEMYLRGGAVPFAKNIHGQNFVAPDNILVFGLAPKKFSPTIPDVGYTAADRGTADLESVCFAVAQLMKDLANDLNWKRLLRADLMEPRDQLRPLGREDLRYLMGIHQNLYNENAKKTIAKTLGFSKSMVINYTDCLWSSRPYYFMREYIETKAPFDFTRVGPVPPLDKRCSLYFSIVSETPIPVVATKVVEHIKACNEKADWRGDPTLKIFTCFMNKVGELIGHDSLKTLGVLGVDNIECSEFMVLDTEGKSDWAIVIMSNRPTSYTDLLTAIHNILANAPTVLKTLLSVLVFSDVLINKKDEEISSEVLDNVIDLFTTELQNSDINIPDIEKTIHGGLRIMLGVERDEFNDSEPDFFEPEEDHNQLTSPQSYDDDEMYIDDSDDDSDD
jgi:hypothetical protein